MLDTIDFLDATQANANASKSTIRSNQLTLYELSQFCDLACKANPNIIVFMLEPDAPRFASPEFEELRSNARKLITMKLVDRCLSNMKQYLAAKKVDNAQLAARELSYRCLRHIAAEHEQSLAPELNHENAQRITEVLRGLKLSYPEFANEVDAPLDAWQQNIRRSILHTRQTAQ